MTMRDPDFDEEAGLRGVLPPAKASFVTFPEGAEPAEVWLVRPADDHSAMHDMIELRRGKKVTLYELQGRPPGKPIAHLLAVCGFTGAAPATAVAHVAEETTAVVRLRGFALPEGASLSLVEAAIQYAMSGRLGGFYPVAVGQSGFHRATSVFEHAWNAAGCPPVRVRHPELVGGDAPAGGRPLSLRGFAEGDPSVLAVRFHEGLGRFVG